MLAARRASYEGLPWISKVKHEEWLNSGSFVEMGRTRLTRELSRKHSQDFGMNEMQKMKGKIWTLG